MDRRTDGVLFRAAGRTRAGTRSRSRISAPRRFRSAARLLARRDYVSCGRPVRRLCAVADLRDRDLLVRVRARPFNHRRDACRHGGATDGRHFRIRGADAQFRPADPCDGALGRDAAVLLARGRGRAAPLLVRARRCGGASPHHHQRRLDPDCRARLVHRAERARTRGGRRRRTLDRDGRADRRPVLACLLAGACRHRFDAGARAAARCRNGRRQ